MSKIIIKMTPFIYEDENTYYFQIFDRPLSNSYYNLFVYEEISKKNFWGKTKKFFKKINESPELIDNELNTYNIKKEIRSVLIKKIVKKKTLEGWDGFVGDIPDHIKQSIKRDSDLNKILGEGKFCQ